MNFVIALSLRLKSNTWPKDTSRLARSSTQDVMGYVSWSLGDAEGRFPSSPRVPDLGATMPDFRKSPPELIARFDELAPFAGDADVSRQEDAATWSEPEG
jgi:hypothetical protein